MRALSSHKHRVRLPLLCGAAILLLCGCACDGNTDLSERYPAYFKYCFGDDAACRFEKIQDDLVHLYTIVYSDKNGEEHRIPLSVLPYDEKAAESYRNAQSYYDAVLETAVMEELASVCRADYIAHVLPEYFSGTPTETGMSFEDGGRLDVRLLCAVQNGNTVGLSRNDTLGAALCAMHIRPVTGWQVYGADWLTAADDPQWYWAVSVTLSPETDAAPYLTQIQAAYEAFLAAGEAPKSCTFQLRQRGETGEDSVSLLWRETVLCGEVLDTAEENTERSLWGTLEENLREYYQKQDD
ncbi:MAG: hypothetical protein IKS42_11730 [Oscillospiraceae bacterium]|nr:hypothetical protein [Oscillospiraceae bacterium]